jgi:hypothetical protein
MAKQYKSRYAEEFYDDDAEGIPTFEEYRAAKDAKRKADNFLRAQDARREVGKAPELTPEILARREAYANDFLLMHKEVFPDSTGEKPFGPDQINSTQWDQKIFKEGGRIIKLEPRGFTKTTRLTNEALFATLLGWQKFTVIVASSMEKATDILSAIKAELVGNVAIADLFPGTAACFAHLKEQGQGAVYQTYGGEQTHIKYTVDSIHFPNIPGEPSSGAIIKVRPLTNLKGINYKIRSGPDKGKVYRPTIYIFDDPQTEDEAESPTNVRKIIKNIKRSALKGGSHARPVSAIMAITPVFYGDVAWHFEHTEESWDLVRYKMVKKMPDQYDLWMKEYAEIRSRFDRTLRGSRDEAYKLASKYVVDNYETLHRGSEVAWDYAYAPGPPLYEVSALQHAINVIIDDGMEDFEFEYQCNTEYGMYSDKITIHAPMERIISKQLPYDRLHLPQETRKVVTHIDVNQDILTYVTMCSGSPMRPHVIDYGVYPDQKGKWSKKSRISTPLRNTYSNPDYREVLYLAVKDLIEWIAQKNYKREDGAVFQNSIIGIDVRFEEQFILRAIRESIFRSIVVPCWGLFVGPDDPALHLQKMEPGTIVYDNCVERMNQSKTMLYFNFDTNFMKTELHKGFNLEAGIRGSVTLFKEQFPNQHMIFAEHCNSERPEIKAGIKQNRTKIIWREKGQQVDNEFMDNASCCLGLFRKVGIQPDHTVVTTEKKNSDINSMINTTKLLVDY